MPIKNTPFNRAVAAGNESQVKISEKQSIKFMSSLFAVVMVLFSGEAAAHFDVTFADVAKSYSNCSYAETDTVATFNLTIS